MIDELKSMIKQMIAGVLNEGEALKLKKSVKTVTNWQPSPVILEIAARKSLRHFPSSLLNIFSRNVCNRN